MRGKLVRITCKHCSTAIIVDGRQMSEAEVASQKPLASYVLPRRDESIVAAMPQSIAPARAPSASSPRPSAVSAPAPPPSSSSGHAPVPAPLRSVMSAEMREDDQTMIARSRFGDEMSVHEERTVIGQIPREALEFERMFAQRTQPPPPEEVPTAPPPAGPLPSSPNLPSFSSAPPPSEAGEAGAGADAAADSSAASVAEADSEKSAPPKAAVSDSPAAAEKPTSDSRGLVSLAEATHPSVARSVSARRLRVTLLTLLVFAVLVGLFVLQKPH